MNRIERNQKGEQLREKSCFFSCCWDKMLDKKQVKVWFLLSYGWRAESNIIRGVLVEGVCRSYS